jgi:hypothetical protein
MTFLMGHLLDLVTLVAVGALVYVALNWSKLPVLQRLVALQFFFIAVHVNEEMRFPGGFVEMVEHKLNFTLTDPHFGELVLSVVILTMFVPALLFPGRVFLAMAPMVLGVFELVAHTAGIWMFDRDFPYTPGLVTAACLLAPVGAYGIHYAVKNHLLRRNDWFFVFLYMLLCVGLAQQVVVRSTGMSYLEFLRNVRKSLVGN